MPIRSIKLRPGINTQAPLLANEGGWSASQLVRFKNGLPQSIGGWLRWINQQLDSPIRTIKSWSDLNGTVWTAFGTDTSVYIWGGNSLLNITPTTATTNPTPNFSTVAGSAVVTIIDNVIGQISGSYVNIVTPVSVGGLILQGIYPIASVVGGDTFTVNAGALATATVANGGAVPTFTTTSGSPAITVIFDNNSQVVDNTFGVPISTTVGGVTLLGSYLVQSAATNTFVIDALTDATSTAGPVAMNGGNAQIVYYGVQGVPSGANYGYGIGGYGLGGYGQGSVYNPDSLPVVPLWTFDNWGETLILCTGTGSIFTWTPGTGQTQAQLIVNAPSINTGIFIAMPELAVVAWGASVNGVQQPLLVAYSTIGDYTTWAPTVENQAGSQTIASGSKVVAGIQAAQQALIFTDIDVWAMNYLGGENTEIPWGFIKIADACGLVGPRAVCKQDQNVFWMAGPQQQGNPTQQLSGGRFMVFTGGEVQTLPCTVWDEVFQDFDWTNAHKVVAASNALFTEVAWYYPSISGGTGENDSYALFNVGEGLWTYGKLGVTGWQDVSASGAPLAGHSDSYAYQHEVGQNANGQPLNWSISTGAVMINEGDEMMFVDWLLPEFQWGMHNNPATNQAVTVAVSAYRYANDTVPTTSSTATYTATGAGFSSPRVRGRHLQFTFSGQGFARLGDVRYRAAPDGKY
jgi:hypothetical protein